MPAFFWDTQTLAYVLLSLVVFLFLIIAFYVFLLYRFEKTEKKSGDVQGLAQRARDDLDTIALHSREELDALTLAQRESLSKLSGEYLSHLSELYGQVQSSQQKLLEESEQQIKLTVLEFRKYITSRQASFADDLRSGLMNETQSFHENLFKTVDEVKQSVKSEYDGYVAVQKEKLKVTLQTYLAHLMQDVVERAITPEEQEKLVMQALTDAEKEGVFHGLE